MVSDRHSIMAISLGIFARSLELLEIELEASPASTTSVLRIFRTISFLSSLPKFGILFFIWPCTSFMKNGSSGKRRTLWYILSISCDDHGLLASSAKLHCAKRFSGFELSHSHLHHNGYFGWTSSPLNLSSPKRQQNPDKTGKIKDASFS